MLRFIDGVAEGQVDLEGVDQHVHDSVEDHY